MMSSTSHEPELCGMTKPTCMQLCTQPILFRFESDLAWKYRLMWQYQVQLPKQACIFTGMN